MKCRTCISDFSIELNLCSAFDQFCRLNGGFRSGLYGWSNAALGAPMWILRTMEGLTRVPLHLGLLFSTVLCHLFQKWD